MDNAPKWKPQSGSEFFADGRTMRPPVHGTVPFGTSALVSQEPWAASFTLERVDFLKEDGAFYTGITGWKEGALPAGYTARIPVTVDLALLDRGQERFGIYCAVCHGYDGDGKGAVAPAWAAPVPSFHDPKYSNPEEPDGKGLDGFFFFTARNGVPGVSGFPQETDPPETRLEKLRALKMPGYAHALSEQDTWAVVAYIRALQESKRGVIDDVPADRRGDLLAKREDQIEKEKAAAPPATAPAQPAAEPAPGANP
jgi:mono/diheme cytochrome c family protein